MVDVPLQSKKRDMEMEFICSRYKELRHLLSFGLEDYSREWKLRNIPEALFFTTYPEMIRTCPEMWDFPVCVPTDRANLNSWKKI